MKKTNLAPVILIVAYLLTSSAASFAASNASYGTTTFFSNRKDVQPPVSQPIYDVGLRSGNKDGGSGSGSGSNGKKKEDQISKGSLFSQVISGIGTVFSDQPIPDNIDKTSLFDWQANSDQNSDGGSSGGLGGEFIMGARGESYENMSAEEIEKYNNKISSKFNFNDSGTQAAPKKSKLLFTNVIIPVDMTTQYVIIILMILLAIGSVTGYYFWKKEMDRVGRKSKKEEDYD